MVDQSNNGPSWARKQQRATGTNWGLVLGIIAICVMGPGVIMGVLRGAQTAQTPGQHFYFGGPSRQQQVDLMKGFYARSKADAGAFDHDLEAATPSAIMTPEALAAPGGVARAKAALQQERVTVEKYHGRYLARKADERRQLAALYTNPSQQADALTRYDARTAPSSEKIADYWRIEFDIVDREEAVIDYLAKSRGAWRPSGGHIVFTRPSLMPAFNEDVNLLRQSKDELNAIVAQVNYSAEQRLAELDANPGY